MTIGMENGRSLVSPANQAITDETIVRIDTQLEELLLFADSVRYTRQVGFASEDADGGFGEIVVETRERLGQEQRQGLSLLFPYKGEEGETADLHRIDLNEGPDGWRIIVPHELDDPRQLLQPLLTANDTPTGLRNLAAFMDTSLSKEEKTESVLIDVNLDDQEFGKLWLGVATTLDEFNVPTRYEYDYPTTLGESTARVGATGVLPGPDGQRLPETDTPFKATHLTVDGDFVFDRVIVNGELIESSYREEIPEHELPDLTEDDRNRHPYAVLPVGFGDNPTFIEAQSIEGDTQPRYPGEGFKVIAAAVGAGLTTSLTFFSPTKEEAQRVADRMYQRDLARARTSNEVSEYRAWYIVRTLDKIIQNARNSAWF